MRKGQRHRDVGGPLAARVGDVGPLLSTTLQVPLTSHNSRRIQSLEKTLRSLPMLATTGKMRVTVKIGSCRYPVPVDVFVPIVQALHKEFTSVPDHRNPDKKVGGWWQSREIKGIIKYMGNVLARNRSFNNPHFDLVLSRGALNVLKADYAHKMERKSDEGGNKREKPAFI